MAKKKSFIIILVLLAANFIAWPIVFAESRRENIKVAFFDVGQGDSAFVETSEGYQVLIDGGPDSVVLEKLAKVLPFWDNSLDLVVLTHPEADHVAGLLEVLKRYRVGNILWTGVVRKTTEYREWQELIDQEGAEIKIAKAGQSIGLGEKLKIEILHPFEDWEGKEMKDSNHTSLVLRLEFSDSSFLFTGDVPAFSEKEMILRGVELDSDVLKVGHHGSKTSSAEEFLEKVSPSLAVISSGRGNSYRHPHQEVLERLEKYGIKIHRTDQEGDIKIIFNGKNYGFSHF